MSVLENVCNNTLRTSLVGTTDLDSFIPVPVANLIGDNKQHFFIPSYQRGYRWDEDQIKDLIDDLKEFVSPNTKDEIYWLQPIVLKKRIWTDSNNNSIEGWEVIDGQQRLTSLYLLLSFLTEGNIPLFDIRYETRPEIDFLNLDKIDPDSNIDSNFIVQNFNYIKESFPKKDYFIKDRIQGALVTNDLEQTNKMAAFIVYVLDADKRNSNNETNDLVKKFNNLNKNQIKLTGSELLKAMFVLAFAEKEDISITEFISEWNEIEYSLQDDKFWAFLSNDTELSTRIDILFDIYADTENNNLQKDASYKNIKQRIKDKEITDFVRFWSDLKEIYETLVLCYEDKRIRHYAGYLTTIKNKTWHQIQIDLKTKNKKDLLETFNEYVLNYLSSIKIYKKGEKSIDTDALFKLDYNKNALVIRKLLLLHNIIFCIQSKDIDFSFKDYKNKENKCDIEHIDPHHENQLTARYDQKIFIEGMSELSLNYLWSDNDEKRNLMITQLNVLKGKAKNILKESETNQKQFSNEFQKFHEEYIKERRKYQEQRKKTSDTDYPIDSIANLALLNYDINREYKDRPFPEKHNTVLRNELKGKFIPPCTKFVFSKKYTKEYADATDPEWNNADKDGYFRDIVNSFDSIITKKKEDLENETYSN